MIPLSLFPDWTGGWLRFLPFQYIYYLPVNTLIGKATTAEWALGLAVTAAWIGIFALATRLAWKRGIAQYTGVGI
jgi:ABC-2 type transport system permease protein